MRGVLAILVLAGGVAGCNANTADVAAAPPGVSYRVSDNNLAETTQRADRYCQDYNRRAHLSGVAQSGSDQIAAYDCR